MFELTNVLRTILGIPSPLLAPLSVLMDHRSRLDDLMSHYGSESFRPGPVSAFTDGVLLRLSSYRNDSVIEWVVVQRCRT